MLQFVLHGGVLKGPDKTLALEKWRHDMCQQVRKHLNEDVDEALRPRERNDSQVVLDVLDDVHASAFLQHHRHSQAIIKLCVANIEFPRYVRVICFSRFDGVVVDSEQDVVDVPIVSDAGIPPLELHLYNSIGITCMDLQYDPMTLLRRGPACNTIGNGLFENNRASCKKNDSKRNIRSRRDSASVAVHDEKPSFLKILPRNSQQDVSIGCVEKNRTSCAKDNAADVANNDIENIGES